MNSLNTMNSGGSSGSGRGSHGSGQLIKSMALNPKPFNSNLMGSSVTPVGDQKNVGKNFKSSKINQKGRG